MEPEYNTTINSGGFLEGGWVVLTLSLLLFVFLYYFFKKFTSLRAENFESYSTHNELLIKVRILSILSATMFPVVEYAQANYLKLYPTDWPPILLIVVVSLFSLAISFRKNPSFAFISALPQASYYSIYGLVMYKLIRAGMMPAMAIETACLVLFSKLIFPKLKQLLFFLAFVIVSNIVLLTVFPIGVYNLQVYLSAIIQVAIVSVALYLVEGSTNRKTGFGSKILESSNLFVLVANKNAEFVYANSQLEKLTGLAQNEILANGWWKYLKYNDETTLGLKELIIDSIKQNQSSNYESTIKDKDGNDVFMSWDNTIIEEQYLLAVGKNITKTKQLQSEEENRKIKSGKYSQVINDLTSSPHHEKTTLHETLGNICRRAAEAMGVERLSLWFLKDDTLVCETQYILSLGSYESGFKLSKKEFPKYFEAISRGDLINATDAANHPDTVEFTKEYFPENKIFSLLDSPILINGTLSGVLCCESVNQIREWDQEDISFARAISGYVAVSVETNKRSELEREYRYILNNAGDIIYTTDSLGNFDFINKTASRLLGYNIDLIKGKHFSTIIHPDYKEKTALFYLRQFKKKIESTYLEFKVVNSEGREFWVGQNVKLITEKENPEKVKGFQAVVRDINKQKETEIALVNSESNFRQLNENINEVFYLFNLHTKQFDYVSPKCKAIFGVDKDYFYSGRNYSNEFVIEEDRHLIKKASETLDFINEEYLLDYRIVVDGKMRWISERSFPITNQYGTVIKRSGVASDITEKKEQEEQLRELSLVAGSVSNGVVISDERGHILWCNNSYLHTFDYTLEELLGKRPIEVFSGPETKSDFVSEIQNTKLENSSIELLQYTKKGVPKWVMITNTPLYDDNGKVKRYIEIVTDITERKTIEKEYRYILDNAGDVIYTTNPLGVVDFLNESVTKILGYKPDELVGKHFTHIIHPDDKKAVNLFYLKQFKQKREDSYNEFRVLHKSGSVNWVGQNVKLLQDVNNPEKVNGFQAILRDITRQKETELALIESENNFRQINETINDVFYLYNIQENKYDYISPNCSNILGVDSIYFYYVNNYVKDYVIPKDREMVEEAYRKIREGEAFDVEYRISIDNEITWIKEKSFVIRDAQGKVVKTSGTCSDVTQKKMQEKRLLKVNKELSLYSEDLEINNLLKEQLIYTDSFEEIAKVVLDTLKVKIKTMARGEMMLLNINNSIFDALHTEDGVVKRKTFNVADLKSYPSLSKGKKFIEHNVDLSSEVSKTDQYYRKENIVSYISLPISYSGKLIGALMVGFETPFSLSKQDIDMLENFTSVLSVVINKLSLQKELSDKSRDIISSLNYAKGIQKSILPNMALHRDRVKSFMSLYMPKDVVSGDFYVVESFDEYTLLALGDCTGHGVPGAFLTLLGSNFLQRIAVENRVTSPVQILELLDYQLFNMLNRNREETIRDGMELGLCIYNSKTKKLTFGGAGLFLLYYKDNVQHIVPGCKRSIGDENHGKVDFEETVIDLNGTEKFYLFSDGYRDQLGGVDKRKRFSRAKFFELLDKIKNLPPFQQEYILKLEHNKHRDKYEQTDDISVIGFELK